ncbi:UNKNOWN [Stylonychia lemnae]|uniref:Prohibitin n=1 Tax=Stylonychia lemnae TaxID=5949 RepID=A0A078AM29_STYLE|nr:UNKNOWN [Stylonychia lemnae]|eukprot:CDW82477.1 UNKNOWN [Stylonychia lemnae]
MAKELLLGSLGFGVFVLSIFLYFSIDSLAYNQVGLNYSSIFKSVENKTYESGIHFIGLGHDFIGYDLTITTLEFSKQSGATLPLISCRTKDGLKLDLEISFQYRVLPASIYEIYNTFGDNLKTVLLRIALDSISDVGTQYRAIDFFTIRQDISAKMRDALNKRLQKDLKCEVVFFQLRSIDLPDKFEQSIQDTEVTKQSILRAEAERVKNNITQQMLIEVSEVKKNVIVNDAKGAASAKTLITKANTQTFQEIQTNQAEAYAKLMKDLGLTKQELIQYLQLNLIKNSQDGALVISINNNAPKTG